jgi:D-3-phosphoglycerate dehydrogenase / 2-oxoglutarate reductase
MTQDRWNVLLPREIHQSGPESIDDIATFTSVSEYGSTEALRDDIDRYDAVIDRLIELDGETIDAATNLKVIAKHGVGLDNIDIERASERDIVVCNTPGANARGVAEHAITLLATVRKRVPIADEDIRSGTWIRHRYSTPELGGDTLGLLGFGDIGSLTGELARGFGMDVLVFDPYIDADQLPDWAQPVEERETLFEESDAISVHVPLTQQTKHLVSSDELEALGDGGIVVNTARGGIVDEEALAEAIENETIAGAGLDVLESEPPDEDNPLLELDSVVFTPHVGGLTEESLQQAATRAAANVRRVYDGDLPETTVNADEVSLE